ncbi:hypothetical protein TUM2805_17420 [Escherichia coli]|nr:hypothetical protein TUM2805_17420 [Escherichia coli]
MDCVHHIWCPLFSQEFQDLPDGAETTLTFKLWATQCTLLRHFYSYLADGDAVDKLLALTV